MAGVQTCEVGTTVTLSNVVSSSCDWW